MEVSPSKQKPLLVCPKLGSSSCFQRLPHPSAADPAVLDKAACYPGDTKTTPPEHSGKAAASSAACQELQGIPQRPRNNEEQGNPSCAPSMGRIPVPAARGEGLQPSTGTPEDPGHGGSAPGPAQAIQEVGEG